MLPRPTPGARLAHAASIVLFLALGTLTACGGGDSAKPVVPPPPPPPPPPQVPASLTLRAGDGQSAEPGKAVAVAPSVVVRDAAGAPVVGVSVLFAVDSGGGSVQGGSATSGADGVATAGSWTLGATEGRHVLIVTSNGVPSIRVSATAAYPIVTLAADKPLPANGGTIGDPQAGAPYNQIEVKVPAGAYPGTTQWTVRARRSIPITLPEGASLAAPVVDITNGQGYADSVMTVTLPTTSDPALPVGAFYYDASTHWLEAVPIADRGDSTVTIALRHFSAASLLVPATGTSPRVGGGLHLTTAASTAAALPFGQVTLIVVAVRASVLATPVTSNFQPGRDDWEFTNYGSAAEPGGICAGMSMTALYYNYRHAARMGFLNGRFSDLANFDDDNAQGIRFASAAQSDAGVAWPTAGGVWLRQVQRLANATHKHPDVVNFNSTVVALYVTGRAVIFDMRGGTIAHAVVAYEARANAILIADVNDPGKSRTISYVNNRFQPLPFSATAGANSTAMTRFTVMGATTMVNLSALDAEWQAFTQGTAGNSTFPAYQLQFRNALTGAWTRITRDTATVYSDTLVARVLCPRCPYLSNGISPADRQRVRIVDYRGALMGEDDGAPFGAEVRLDSLRQKLGVVREGWDANADGLFLDFSWITVTSMPTRINRRDVGVFVDTLESFVATHRSTHPAGAKYRWIFRDGRGADTIQRTPGDSTVAYRFRRTGTYTVKVEVDSPTGTRIGLDSTTTIVSDLNRFTWRFTSASLTQVTLPVGGIGATRTDTAIYNTITQAVATMQSRPSGTGLYVVGNATGRAGCNAGAMLQQFPAGQFSDTAVTNIVPTALVGSCGDPDYLGNLSLGPLGSGQLKGDAVEIPNPNQIILPGGEIDATMTGRTLRGTVTIYVRFSTGLGYYDLSFTAQQVRP